MRKNNSQLYMINKFLRYRADVIKYIFSAIILVIILSIFSNALMLVMSSYATRICLVCAGLLVAALFACFGYRILPCLQQENIYTGRIFINKQKKQLISIRDYMFSWKLKEYLTGILAEDKQLARQWRQGGKQFRSATKSVKLLAEASDFYLISLLASVLEDFFAASKPRIPLKHYTRKELLPLLGQNHLFDLFTKSMKSRASFKQGYDFGLGKDNKLYQAVAFNGAYYEYIDLILPMSYKLVVNEKDPELLLQIITPQATIQLYRAVLLYEKVYTPHSLLYATDGSQPNWLETASIDIEVRVCVRLNRWRAPFSHTLKELEWVDALHRILEQNFDIEYFEQKLPERTCHYLFEKLLQVERKTDQYKALTPPPVRSHILY